MEFRERYHFLSNLYPCPVSYEGLVYPSAENAFQAAKCLYPADKTAFSRISPQEAKKAGRHIRLRPDWEQEKVSVMRGVVRAKFLQNRNLTQGLIFHVNTLDQIVEENHWHDNFWGSCLCERCKNTKGQNILGDILAEVRYEMMNSPGADFPFPAFQCWSRMYDLKDCLGTSVEFLDRVDFGRYSWNGNACAARMEWRSISNKVCPVLTIYNDEYKAILYLIGVVKELEQLDGCDYSPDDFSRLLLRLGFQDLSHIPLPKKLNTDRKGSVMS